MGTHYFLFFLLGGLLPLAYMAFYLGRKKVLVKKQTGVQFHSKPGSYGWYALIWMILPVMLIYLLSSLLHFFNIITVPKSILLIAILCLALIAMYAALKKIEPSVRARLFLEKTIRWILFLAAGISIMTTIGIVLTIVFQAIKFFDMVSFWNFVTGTNWSPDTAFLGGAERTGEDHANASFGSVPIFAGTFMITAIAMLVALPVGLLAAIFMSEYSPLRLRNISKPTLEVLAGIPTVVYGFFAAITVSPLVVDFAESLGVEAAYTNALAPGVVMGIMIIPFISSLSDDVISSLPHSLREGSLALGTTKSETIKQVLLPAALPGIVSAFLLGVSRALGETMIVVMAAGLRPNLTWNPLEGMTTVTVRIVDALTGDTSFDSAETLSAFGLGLVLLVITLFLNMISIIVIRKFKQQYE